MSNSLRIVFIEDDSAVGTCLKAWAKDIGHRAWIVDSALDANKINADYYLFDISAVGGLYQVDHCYSPICSIAANHPGATMGVLTAWPKKSIQEVLDVIEKETGQQPLYVQSGRDVFESLEKVLI